MSSVPSSEWQDVGAVDELKQRPVQVIQMGRGALALSYRDGVFGVVSGVCNHAGGPLGEGTLEGEYIVCPWHHYKFHRITGEGEPGFEADRVPRHELREENGRLLVRVAPSTTRNKLPHAPHPLSRPLVREPGPMRLLGLSTTAMDLEHPRYSTSEELLKSGLDHAASALGAETKLIRLGDLKFRHCEGYYSKSAHACTWPCSITQMDETDQLTEVYENMIFWADAILLATPIRWGSASSLYFKMIERMNCIQNQITIRNRVLIQNKAVGFIITGGQDNIQSVAGQMLMFFAELGFDFPRFPFIAHSRGWSAEDMEQNVVFVRESAELREAAEGLAARTVAKAEQLVAVGGEPVRIERGGRKAHRMG